MAGLSKLRRFFVRGLSSNETDGAHVSLPDLVYGNIAVRMLEKALQQGLNDVSERDRYRNTALHQAVRRRDCAVISLLLKHGADRCAENKEGLTALMLAVLIPTSELQQRCDIAKSLLDGLAGQVKDQLLHINSKNKYTVFHYLAREGHLDMLKVVLDRFDSIDGGASLREEYIDKRTGYEGPSAVHLAAAHCHSNVLKQLLMAGGSIVEGDDLQSTPLHHASECGCERIVDCIIEHAEDYGAKASELLIKEDNLKRVPYHSAACKDHLSCLRKLIAACIKEEVDLTLTEENGRTLLSCSCVMGHVDIVDWLISDTDVGPKVKAQFEITDDQGRTPFHLAAMYGHMNIVKMLAEKGANVATVTSDGTTPLMTVAEHCPPETAKQLVSVLLRVGVKAAAHDCNHHTALHCAVLNNQSRVGGAIARRLLNSAKNTEEKRVMCEAKDVNGWSVLHLAARRGHIGVLNAVLQLRADGDGDRLLVNIESVTHEERNVLHLAAEYGRAGIVRRIVRLLASDVTLKLVNKQDCCGLTPCHLAAVENHANVLELLLESGAAPDSKDLNRCTPLHYAAQGGSIRIAQMLLRYAPGMVNAADIDQTSPLLVACESGHCNMVKLLLSHGADFRQNKDCHSPLDIAAGNRHSDIVRELLNSDDWRSLLNYSHSLVADTILEKTPRAMKTLLDRFAVQGTDSDGREVTISHLYYLYYKPCPEDIADALAKEQIAAQSHCQQRRIPQQRASPTDSRGTLTSPVDRPTSISSGLSLSFDSEFPPSIRGRSASMPNGLFRKPARNTMPSPSPQEWKPPGSSSSSSSTVPSRGSLGTSVVVRQRRKGASLSVRKSAPVMPIVEATTDGDEADGDDEPDSGVAVTQPTAAAFNGSAACVAEQRPSAVPDDTAPAEYVSPEQAFAFALNLDSASGSATSTPVSESRRGKLSRDASMDLDTATVARETVPPNVGTQHTALASALQATPGQATAVARTSSRATGPRRAFSQLSKNCRNEDEDEDEDDEEETFAQQTLDMSGSRTEFSRMSSRASSSPSAEDEPDGPGTDIVRILTDQLPSQIRLTSRPNSSGDDAGVDTMDGKPSESATVLLVKHWKNDTSCCGTEPCLVEAIMKSKHHELLLHPVVREWAENKWHGYVRLMNYLYFFLCIVFLVTLLAFVMINKQTQAQDTCDAEDLQTATCLREECTRSTVFRYLSDGGMFPNLRGWLLSMCVILIIGELSQMARMRRRYFCYASNYLQWAIAVFSLLFVLPLAPQPLAYQWMAGSVAVFLAWINIILCVQWSTPLGIYVAMFNHILRSALRALILVVLFVAAFGFTFYILLSDKDSFSTIGQSLMKTVGMTVGEIELAETFLTDSDTGGPENFGEYREMYKFLKYIVVLLFILILPTITQNLLIGMAAGEAADVKRNAVMELAKHEIETVLEWEYSLPQSILSKVAHFPITMKPKNDQGSWKQWFSTFLTGVNTSDESEQAGSLDFSDMQARVEQLTELSHVMVASLDSQQLLLDNQSHRLDRILNRQRRQQKFLDANTNERSLDMGNVR